MPPRTSKKKTVMTTDVVAMDNILDEVVADAVAVVAEVDAVADVVADVADVVADVADVEVADADADVVADADAEAPAEPAKKRPGRPKKRVITEPIEINGVTDRPRDPECGVEMVYQNPSLFKNIFALFKAYESTEIMIHFKEQTIELASSDRFKKTYIGNTIDCTKLVHYYCAEPKRVVIRRHELEHILCCMRKVHARITIIYKPTYPSHIVVQTENSEVGNRNIYEVPLCQIKEEIFDTQYAENEYPLRFTLPAKHFKEEITGIGKLSTKFTIEKNYGSHLAFSFENIITKLNMTSPYLKPEKIKLVSNISPNDVFAVSINIEYIKPFANAKLGGKISIFVDTNKKILFKTKLDEGVCTVRVYSSIINIEPER